MTPSVGTLVAQRFELIRTLGQGGMGVVWLAYDTRLSVQCAVKFLTSRTSAEARTRFEREARSAAQLRSPHVVQILDHGEHQGLPYIAMELLDGEDLSTRLKSVGRLDPATTLRFVTQIAKALTKAHAAGLVHRDLKPANVCIIPDEDGEVVKVLDFGVAKELGTFAALSFRGADLPDLAEHDGMTRTGALMGTPAYMSPEQVEARGTVDTRADLWSLAFLTFRCLTGRLPFESDDVAETLMMILEDPLPLPSQLAPHLPIAVDAWFLRAAARQPAERFQTARELADALAAALGEPKTLASQDGSSTSALLPMDATANRLATAPTIADASDLQGSPRTAVSIATDAGTSPSRPKRFLILAAALGLITIAGLSVALWSWSRAAPKSRVSSSAVRSQPPPEVGCELTMQCPDMLHQVCGMDWPKPSRCVPSDAAAKIALHYDNLPNRWVGPARRGTLDFDGQTKVMELSLWFGEAGQRGIGTITLKLKKPVAVGVTAIAGPDITVEVAENMWPDAKPREGHYKVVKGTLDIRVIDYRFGGQIAGSIDAQLSGGRSATPITGKLLLEFSAKFPNDIPR